MDVVADVSTGVTAASGCTVYADDVCVIVEGFQVVAASGDVPDAVGGYEAAKELAEGEEE
jgi:hypothetical protein